MAVGTNMTQKDYEHLEQSANKNKKELRNIWKYLPNYFEKLKEIQAEIERPMKRWECKKYGKYGDVFKIEYVFQLEEWQNEPAKPKEDG